MKTEKIIIPKGACLEAMRDAFAGKPKELWGAFRWDQTAEGQKYWEVQAELYVLSNDAKEKLGRMIEAME